MLRNQKGQALLELAILGGFILMAFSIIINLSEDFNRTHSYMQQTFRANLKKAQEINNSVAWTTADFRRLPDVIGPGDMGQLGVYTNSNSVLWADGKLKPDGTLEHPESKAYYQLNREQEYTQEIPVTDTSIAAGDVTVSSFGFSSDARSSSYLHQRQSPGANMVAGKSHSNADSITGSMDIGETTVSLDSTLAGNGIYTPN